MNKKFVLLIFMFVFWGQTLFSQAPYVEFKFQFTLTTNGPTCNPFVDNSSNFEYQFNGVSYVKWKPSHGSPQVYDVWGQNTYDGGALLKTSDSFETEGVFIEYNFSPYHKYDFEIAVMNPTAGWSSGLEIYAANDLYENCASNCEEMVMLEIPDKVKILDEYPIDNVHGLITTFNVENWIPTKNYSYILISSGFYSSIPTGIVVNRISIIDNGPDLEPPTIPVLYPATDVTSNSFKLSWSASTDNIGLAGYKVYKNGQFYKNVTGTSLVVNNLEECTEYNMKVTAYDLAGNISDWSNLIVVHTISSIPKYLILNQEINGESASINEALNEIVLIPGFRFKAKSNGYFAAKLSTGCDKYKILTNNGADIVDSEPINREIKSEITNQYYLDKPELRAEKKSEFANGVRVYPNPTNGKIHIDNIDFNTIKKIEIVSISGAVLLVVDENFSSIDLKSNGLPKGLFIICIHTENEIFKEKVIFN